MMAVIAFALTSIGLVIAWRIESTQGFHAIMNLILIPIWMLSGAFFPARRSAWMAAVDDAAQSAELRDGGVAGDSLPRHF